MREVQFLVTSEQFNCCLFSLFLFQRNSAGSLNSNAVLKLMGRGGMRGVGPPRGGPGRGGIRGDPDQHSLQCQYII